jgi:hypothetical protein
MITGPKTQPPDFEDVDPLEVRIAVGTEDAAGENELVDLGRLAWLATVLVCLVTVLVLVLQGYFGYAAVTLAVAAAAAINLF